ncbi:MAG: hypothetical protein Kow0090_07650 [Myxococcota bacterium]
MSATSFPNRREKFKKASILLAAAIFIISSVALSYFYAIKNYLTETSAAPKSLPIGKLVISGFSEPGEDNDGGVAGDIAGDILEKQLKESGKFHFVETKETKDDYYIVKLVFLGISDFAAGKEKDAANRKENRASFNIELKIAPKETASRLDSFAASGRAVFERSAKEHNYAFLVEKSVKDALEKITSELDITFLTEEKLIEILEGEGDRNLRLLAIKRLGELRSEKALDPLIKALKEKNISRQTAEGIIGALTQIGDSRAAADVIKFFKLTDEVQVIQAINFAADLGGEDAVAFLTAIAAGHPSRKVRIHAETALEKLKLGEANKISSELLMKK